MLSRPATRPPPLPGSAEEFALAPGDDTFNATFKLLHRQLEKRGDGSRGDGRLGFGELRR